MSLSQCSEAVANLPAPRRPDRSHAPSPNYTKELRRNVTEFCWMPKALTISGFVVAALLLVVFGLVLALGILNGSKTMDAGFVVCAAILGYLSWNTWRGLT